MPWTPQQFKSRHNKGLNKPQADEASRVANAVLKSSGDEGKAIRIANAIVRKNRGHPKTGEK